MAAIFIVVLVSALAAAYAGQSPKRYTGQAVLVVPAATAGTLPPGNPDGATKLASTLAALLPADRALINQVATMANLTADEIVKHLKVTNDNSTAILRVNYTGESPTATVAIVNAIATAATSPNPPGPIDAGALRIAQLPTSVTPSGHNAGSALPIGLAIGIVLAFLAVVGLERANPRIDSPTELAEATNGPVTSWRSVTPGGVSALVSRWISMVDLPQPDIALVGVGRISHRVLLGVADDIEAFAERGKTAKPDSSGPDQHGGGTDRSSSVMLRIADMSDPEFSGDQIVQVSDLSVLVVQAGVKASAVFATLRRLGNYGASPRWSIIAHRDAARATRQRSVTPARVG